MSNSSCILVTGAAGFIGVNLIKKLLSYSRFQVIGIDNLANKSSSLALKQLSCFQKKTNFLFYKTDLKEYDKIENIFQKHHFYHVIHLAAETGVRESLKYPLSYVDNNIAVTNNLLELCVKFQANNFIFASSSSVYGNYYNKMSESVPPSPISPYAVSKRACELYTKMYSEIYSINATVLRFFTVYGPFQRSSMAISNFISNNLKNDPIIIYGDGTTSRDFTYVDDIIQGIIKSLTKQFKWEVINLGSGTSTSLLSLIEKIENLTNKKFKIIFKKRNKGDVIFTLADITKAQKLLGYKVSTSIDEGLKKYIKWYQSNMNHM